MLLSNQQDKARYKPYTDGVTRVEGPLPLPESNHHAISHNHRSTPKNRRRARLSKPHLRYDLRQGRIVWRQSRYPVDWGIRTLAPN